MLVELKVSDLGIIEDIDWRLDSGLNVITGETGAGKSLIIDAVELLLTGSAGEQVIRSGASKAFVEGVFHLTSSGDLAPLADILKTSNLSPDENSLVINCDVRKGRPSSVKINGRTVTRGTLRQIGQLLIDIHGQSQHLSLLDSKLHLYYLDSFSGSHPLRQAFGEKTAQLRKIESEIKNLEQQQTETARQEEFLKFQIDEIKQTKIKIGEDEELEEQKRLIASSAKLKEYAIRIYQTLSEGENYGDGAPIISRLNRVIQDFKKLSEMDPFLKPNLEILEKATLALEDLTHDVYSYAEKLDFDPNRLETIEERLEILHRLKRKYGKTIVDILDCSDQLEAQLALVCSSGARKGQLEEERLKLRLEMAESAAKLSAERFSGVKKLNQSVRQELSTLEMGHMDFEVKISQTPSTEGLQLKTGEMFAFSQTGIDKVEFLVSTNPGEPLKPLDKIASTGELSRFTLALKSVLAAADTVPVLIFDEIDIGIGGRSGDNIGKKLWSLSRHHQVICVTHLPQIAAYADAHFYVHKEVQEARTTSVLENLDENARIAELAAMIGGKSYSESVVLSARELLFNATRWKHAQSES